jgi:hypothetical protein
MLDDRRSRPMTRSEERGWPAVVITNLAPLRADTVDGAERLRPSPSRPLPWSLCSRTFRR